MTQLKNRFYAIAVELDGISALIKVDTGKTNRFNRNKIFEDGCRYGRLISTVIEGYESVEDFTDCSIFSSMDSAKKYLRDAQNLAKKKYKKGERPRFHPVRIKHEQLLTHPAGKLHFSVKR